jgi:hypothetical protein
MMKNVTDRSIALAGSAGDGSEYQYHPRVMGVAYGFRLAPDALEWDLGGRSGRLPYRDITFIRFSLRPTNLMSNRYLTEIWSRGGPKLAIASVSAKGMLVSEDRGPAYRPFIMKLAARVEAAAPACRLESGLPQWRWYPAVVFAAATFAAVLYVMGRALVTGEIPLAVLMAIFGALFVWQVGLMLLRNRPRICEARAIPKEVLP